MLRRGPTVIIALLLGCTDADPGPEATRRETPTGREAPGLTAPGGSANLIQPETVEIGDTVAGLVVTAVDTRPLPDDSSVWSGTVRLQGPLTLSGVYVPHFDYPEVDALCFHPDSASAERIPRFAPDSRSRPDRKRWFCFRNRDAAAAAFPVPLQPREARIRVDGYVVHRQFTDAVDEAELLEVLETGPDRENTLRSTEH